MEPCPSGACLKLSCILMWKQDLIANLSVLWALCTLYKCHKDLNAHVQFYIAQHFFVSQKWSSSNQKNISNLIICMPSPFQTAQYSFWINLWELVAKQIRVKLCCRVEREGIFLEIHILNSPRCRGDSVGLHPRARSAAQICTACVRLAAQWRIELGH